MLSLVHRERHAYRPRSNTLSALMSRLDDLPADRKAVLQLLLKQRKSYDDLSGLLRIDPSRPSPSAPATRSISSAPTTRRD